MKANNIVQDKSFAFAIRIVNLYKYLISDKKEFVLSKQLLRSGTSIGANVEEAIGGISNKDFEFKLSISYKEVRETIYWLRLLKETNYLSQTEFESLFLDADEICKILGKIIVTLKSRK
jgi:four helix bundle protein